MPNKIPYTYDQIHMLSTKLSSHVKASTFEPEIIVPLVRGGLIPGTIISHQLDVDVCPLDISLRDRPEQDASLEILDLFHKLKFFQKILFIDDICDSGATYAYIKKDWDYFSSQRVDWSNVRFGCLQKRYTNTFPVDYYVEHLEHDDWIVYPWEP